MPYQPGSAPPARMSRGGSCRRPWVLSVRLPRTDGRRSSTRPAVLCRCAVALLGGDARSELSRRRSPEEQVEARAGWCPRPSHETTWPDRELVEPVARLLVAGHEVAEVQLALALPLSPSLTILIFWIVTSAVPTRCGTCRAARRCGPGRPWPVRPTCTACPAGGCRSGLPGPVVPGLVRSKTIVELRWPARSHGLVARDDQLDLRVRRRLQIGVRDLQSGGFRLGEQGRLMHCTEQPSPESSVSGPPRPWSSPAAS